MWIEIEEIDRLLEQGVVTPYAGVWIEMIKKPLGNGSQIVTPYAGVWIEISNIIKSPNGSTSLPTRECGLKFHETFKILCESIVTPYAGVWIEIYLE